MLPWGPIASRSFSVSLACHSPLVRIRGLQIFAEVEDSGSFYDLYEPCELLQVAFDSDVSDGTTLEFGLHTVE